VISCREAAELIPLHVGDDLPGEEAARIEDHLESCALCSAEYASFASAREALVGLREEMPQPGSLWAGVALGIGAPTDAAVPAAALTGAGRPRRQPRWAAWTGLAAAAVVAVVFLPQFFRGAGEPTPGGPAPATVSGAPMVEAATAEELRNFLLRSSVREVPAVNEEFLPLTTPAAAQPGLQPQFRQREPAKVY
jgi:anti-sigma factor RsiW